MTQVWFPSKKSATTVKSTGQFLPLSPKEVTALAIRLADYRWLYRWGPWSGGAFLVTMLWATEWRLMLATGLGVGGMRLVYWLLTHHQELQAKQWQQFFSGPQGRLTIASGGGGLTAIGTYMATMVWSEVENPWFATGIILQGLGSLATVGLLLWQRRKVTAPKLLTAPVSDFDRCLHYLAHGDRLQKLIALRQLQQWQNQENQDSPNPRELALYLQAFLDIEEDPALQRAALHLLQQCQQSAIRPEPLSIPQRQRQRQAIE